MRIDRTRREERKKEKRIRTPRLELGTYRLLRNILQPTALPAELSSDVHATFFDVIFSLFMSRYRSFFRLKLFRKQSSRWCDRNLMWNRCWLGKEANSKTYRTLYEERKLSKCHNVRQLSWADWDRRWWCWSCEPNRVWRSTLARLRVTPSKSKPNI